MPEPKCAQKAPYVVDVEAGTVFWCGCGESKNQPFCDGSHRGTGLGPTKVDIPEATRVAFCGCKRSAKGHLCDGTHRTV